MGISLKWRRMDRRHWADKNGGSQAVACRDGLSFKHGVSLYPTQASFFCISLVLEMRSQTEQKATFAVAVHLEEATLPGATSVVMLRPLSSPLYPSSPPKFTNSTVLIWYSGVVVQIKGTRLGIAMPGAFFLKKKKPCVCCALFLKKLKNVQFVQIVVFCIAFF